MYLLKAQNNTGILIKTIIALIIFNLIAPNFFIFRDMSYFIILEEILHHITIVIIMMLSYFIGLEIKRVNIDVLKSNLSGLLPSKIFLIISVILALLLPVLDLRPRIADNMFFFDRYLEYFFNGYLILSLTLGIFAVFGTQRTTNYTSEQELKNNRKIILKKVLLYTSPITVILLAYVVYINSYRMSINDFSYIDSQGIEYIKVQYCDNYIDKSIDVKYENQEEILEIYNIIQKYSFDCSINTFIPNASVMSMSNFTNSKGRDSLLITIVYENESHVEYISLIQDGRLRITNIKHKSTYALNQNEANNLFSDFYDFVWN